MLKHGCPPNLFGRGGHKRAYQHQQVYRASGRKAAKIMGMYPKKGRIQIGSDADLLLWDSELTKTLTVNNLHQKCDYTPPYEGSR